MIRIIHRKIIIILLILLLIQLTINQTILGNENNMDSFNLTVIENKIMVSNNLPDLNIIGLKSWWGYTNTTGIFVDFDIINSGENYHSLIPIESNLTFFADDNTTPFGYIILTFFADDNTTPFGYIMQKPFFDPYSWYKGEILGGNNFFNIDEKPDYITVEVDFTNNITEINENNNNKTINVEFGIQISGMIYKKVNDELIRIDEIVELNQYNDTSISDVGFRHFWSNEHSEFNISLCPNEPLDEFHVYDIKAFFPYENIKIVKKTEPLKAGDNITLDIILDGNQPNIPNNLFGLNIGIRYRNITFITSSIDIDDDDLYYKFKWGDKTYTDWLGPYKSNKKILATHSWEIPEQYTINVITKDSKDIISEWSDESYISIIDKIDINNYQNIIFQIIQYFLKNLEN